MVKSRFVSAALLAAAVAFAMPSMALAQGRGHGGDHGGDHGDHGRGNGGDHGGGDHGGWRGGGGDHGNGGGDHGDRGGWRAGGGDHGGGGTAWRGGGGTEWRGGGGTAWRGGGDHGGGGTAWRGDWDRGGSAWRGGGEVRYRPTERGDVFRFREGGRAWVPTRTYDRTYYRGGYAWAPRTYGYRYGGFSFRDHPRYFYYSSFFPRPHFFRSGFSIGFVLGAYPSYGYRYYDPYCGRYFRSLEFYDEHCDELDHPPVVEVLHYGEPVATAVFEGGRLVVDDCY